MVISHINRDQLNKIEPHYTVHPHTTLLFVDISGYTALAQKLGSEGTLGTEKLSEVRMSEKIKATIAIASGCCQVANALKSKHNMAK